MVGVAIVLAWAGLGYRLFLVQAVEAATHASRGESQRVREEALPAAKGTIYDREGVELAVTVNAVTITANPSQIEDPVGLAHLLAPMLDADETALRGHLIGDGQFAYVARRIDRDTAIEIQEMVEEEGIVGLHFSPEPKRVYPAGPLAAQIVGFVRSDDMAGLEGLELAFEEELTGTPGRQIVERDRFGTPIPQGEFLIEPPVPGSDIVLTIDRDIQFAAERALTDALDETGARAGTVVVLEVSSGGVLAMANAPGFDPNDRSDTSPDLYRNRAVADVYEPGSTLKVVTLAAALEEDLVSPATEFDLPAELEIHETTYTDESRTQPTTLSVAQIVARSSNIGTIVIQGLLGNERHHDYLARFGIGTATGVGLPAEASGRLHPLADWCLTTCGPSTAIGYRVDVTPLQMAAVFATIANDGVWVQPTIVSEIIDGSGESITPERVERTVVSQGTARLLRHLLAGVVDGGTGFRAEIPGYTVGGKTGTTKKLIPGVGYSDTDRIASFIGIAPIDDPEIVVAVVLDSPAGEIADSLGQVQELEFGGVSAAPVFAEVAEATLHQLGVPPDGG